MAERHLLEKLASLTGSLSANLRDLEGQNFDALGDHFVLRRSHIVKAFKKFRAKEISKDQYVEWANALEARDDTEYEPEFEREIASFLTIAANPDLYGDDWTDCLIEHYRILET